MGTNLLSKRVPREDVLHEGAPAIVSGNADILALLFRTNNKLGDSAVP
jgi:hypothetical protein